jgi:tetratricopeptide (TPR) repeat protein
MIVKNEAAVLGRCIASCRGLIDHWVICDTGSTDGTQDLIRRELEGIPGELHEHEWVDFGHNRSELMKLAHSKADYLLLIDGDMAVVGSGKLPALTADSYRLRQGNERFDYRNKRLVRGDLRWRYVGATHEYIECVDEEKSAENLDALFIEDYGDGGSKADKFERDRRLLEEELERKPDDPRTLFYLAQTYRDLGGASNDRDILEQSCELYERRAKTPGWVEETYCSWRQLGILSAQLGDWPRAVDAFITAWETRPVRLEATHDLAVGLLERRHHQSAHRFTSVAASLRPLPLPEDLLFVEPWIYEWGMLFQYSISAYWVGEFDNSIRACKRLLTIDSLPETHRNQTNENLKHAFRERARQIAERPPVPPRELPHVGMPTRGRASLSG